MKIALVYLAFAAIFLVRPASATVRRDCVKLLLESSDELVDFSPRRDLSVSGSEAQVGKRFKVSQILPGVFHVVFPNQREMSSTFMRFQEHFESPRFRGEAFSRTKFKKWYVSENGGFSYYEDWAGFNIPSSILEPFYEGRFKRLNRRERAMLDFFAGQKDRFYVIGTSVDSRADTIKHETGHALYYVSRDYHDAVDAILAQVDTKPIKQYIARMGYHENSLHDEAHAYLMTDHDLLEKVGFDLTPYRNVVRQLNENFEKFVR